MVTCETATLGEIAGTPSWLGRVLTSNDKEVPILNACLERTLFRWPFFIAPTARIDRSFRCPKSLSLSTLQVSESSRSLDLCSCCPKTDENEKDGVKTYRFKPRWGLYSWVTARTVCLSGLKDYLQDVLSGWL
jgi:hypothetical protein